MQQVWKPHSCSLCRDPNKVGEHIKAHAAWVPNCHFCFTVCMCIRETSDYLKSIWALCPRRSRVDALCHQRERDWSPLFSSFSWFFAAWIQQSHGEKYVKTAQTHIQAHKPTQMQEMFHCCQSWGCSQWDDGGNVSSFTWWHMCASVLCLCSSDQDMISRPLNLSLHPSRRKMTSSVQMTWSCD